MQEINKNSGNLEYQQNFKIFQIQRLLYIMGKKILRKGKKPSKSLTELYERITHIQTDILSRFSRLKSKSKLQLCQHLQSSQIPPSFHPQINYFDLYWRQFFLNQISKGQITKFKACSHYLSQKIGKIEELFNRRQQLLAPYQQTKILDINRQPSHNYVCTICKQQFEVMQALFQHREAQHTRNQQLFFI